LKNWLAHATALALGIGLALVALMVLETDQVPRQVRDSSARASIQDGERSDEGVRAPDNGRVRAYNTQPAQPAAARPAGAPRFVATAPPDLTSEPARQAGKSNDDTTLGAMSALSRLTSNPRQILKGFERMLVQSPSVETCTRQMLPRTDRGTFLLDAIIALTGVARDQKLQLTETAFAENGNAGDPELRRCLAAAFSKITIDCPNCKDGEVTFEWRIRGAFGPPEEPAPP
jgi:hypothetical protein